MGVSSNCMKDNKVLTKTFYPQFGLLSKSSEVYFSVEQRVSTLEGKFKYVK